jgi:hypothetical protein
MNNATCEPSPTVPVPRYSARRTLHHVDFFCDAPKAAHVCLVGDFNDWKPTATPMLRMPDGRLMASVVDGTPRLDPKASGVARNDRNEPVSLIAVS